MRSGSGLGSRTMGRSCRLSLTLAVALALATATPVAAGRTEGRSHDFDLQHIRLTLSLDLAARKILGEAQLTLAPLVGNMTRLELDAGELQIERVTVNGTAARFRTDRDQLWIDLDRAYRSGETIQLAVRYQAQPRKGLYFVGPDTDYPDRRWQIWSQGEEEDNHFWFPCYDYPNDKTTSEVIVTVPTDWVALSNGKLIAEREDPTHRTRTFHWKESLPHSTYLITLVAGQFEVKQEEWKVPLSYYVPRGDGAKIPVTFGRTREMMEFFSNWLMPYPWEKYAQAAVEEFIYGAMENTSATTVAYSLLYEERSAPDLRIRNDSVIAHELAHQWFGDLVTTKNWRNFWLNEGFANYAAWRWTRHKYSDDEFYFRLHAAAEQYLRNTRVHPIPIRTMESEALGGLVTLYYSKAAWVLHMLNGELGEARFTQALRAYLEANRFKNVDTAGFARAVEESTGQDIEPFLEQWVYKPGHPEFQVAWEYDEAKKLVHLTVKQTQKAEDGVPIFRLPVEVEFTTPQHTQSVTIQIESAAQEFYFPLSERPLLVLFDKPYEVLKAADFKKSPEEWLYQLKYAQPVAHRLDAADALGKLAPTPAVITGLRAAASGDPFAGVRAAALRALARLATEEAKPALLAAFDDPDARVRRVAAAELGNLKPAPETLRALEDRVAIDPSENVRADSLEALAKLRPENIVTILKAALQQDSHAELIRRAALDGFGALGDDANLPIVLEWAARGKPIEARPSAVAALGKLGKGKKEPREKLIALLADASWQVREAAVRALQERGEPAALAALERLEANDPNERVVYWAKRAIEEMRKTEAKAAASADATKLGQRLAEMEKENKELKERIRALEQQLGAKTGQPATGGQVH